MSNRLMRGALVLAVGALAACQGQIGEPAQGAPAAPGGSGGPGGTATGGPGGSTSTGGGTGGPALQCTNPTLPAPGRSPLRRLNRAEYKTTVGDLLGVSTTIANTFPPDNAGLGFTNNADVLSVTNLLAEAYMTAAESFATAAVANLTTLLPCDPVKAGEDVCAKQFISDFGLRAFRRPLTADENAAFFTLYGTGKTGGVFADGVELVIEAMLQSADFLYRVEKGDPTAPPDAVAPVDHYEMATRLSYFFWGTMPDKALFDAAGAKQLGTSAEVETQVRRMLADPKAKVAVANFHREWLNMDGVAGADKDKTLFPEFTDAVRVGLQQEVSTFVDQAFWNDGKFETLFTAPYSYLDKQLAGFYGLTPPGADGFVKVNLDPKQRAGIVTQGALLAANAKPNQTSPVLRGKFVREQFLCQQLPPPPANLIIVPPEVKPGSTTRERFAVHEKDASCASCHKMMDGLGVGFEEYDPLGRWRTVDQGLPVDSSGTVIETRDADGPFNGGVELATRLGASAEVRECLIRQWFRYANGRSEIIADGCTLSRLYQGFDDGGHDMRELRVKIALSDAFRYRSVQGGGQ